MRQISLEDAKNIRFDKLSLALGTFDGLHVGHMALIEAVKGGRGESAVFTFDSVPMELFNADTRPMRLFTLEEKAAAFRFTGIDYLCAVHFDRAMAAVRHDVFLGTLIRAFHPERVIVGYNFSYGRRAEGNAETLQAAGDALGFEVCVIPPVMFEGEPVSSTRIRECLLAGRVERVGMLLGYSYSVGGVVGHGRGIGHKLLYPTANIEVSHEKLLPRKGVYEVSVIAEGQKYRGVCNIGVNPTVSKGSRETVETHIIGLDRDLYDQHITIQFIRRIRDELRFPDAQSLREQITCDIESILMDK
jgi:riboflavin kinase/FMN adenylyltransferase